jgi:hypothetical protein
MPVTIKCFGEGVRLWLCETSTEIWSDWQSIREDNELEWEELFFNLSFLKKYGYTHWSDMAVRKEIKVFLCNDTNKIEIKQNRKVLERMRSRDLNLTETLFPLYQTEDVQIEFSKSSNGALFILYQLEIGTFAKFELPDHFDINQLNFQVINPFGILDQKGLMQLQYKTKILKSTGDDTLVRSSRVLFIGSR